MVYKRILVAVDGSDTSILAMQEAIALAKDQQATLKLVYVVDEFMVVSEGVPFDFKKYEASIRKHGQSILNKMEALAKKEGLSIESSLIENTDYSTRIPEKIVQESINWQADLIIIGTHGRRGFSHLMLGSVAEGVIRLASIPVLLIRGKE
ncbi:MAG: universal stress protein [Gammaproteobacteria bacterium]